MSDSVLPHRRQPTRLPSPWDSSGKNTGVGCHFLLQCMKMKSESEVAQSCPTLRNPMDCRPPRLLRPWDFPGKSAGMGCHCSHKKKKNGILPFVVTWKDLEWIMLIEISQTEKDKYCIQNLKNGEVSGHRVLIKRRPGNRGPTEGGTTHEATSGMSS